MNQTLCNIFTDTLAAGAQKIYQVGYGRVLYLYANTGTSGTLKFSFDQQAFNALIVGQVVKSSDKFLEIVVQNTDTGSATFTFIIASEDITFNGVTIGNTVTTATGQSSTGVFAADVATGNAAKVFTGISNYFVVLQADFTNGDYVYIGFDNTVSATKKIVALQAGQTYILEKFKGDIYAFSSTAQKLSVSYAT